MRPLLSLFMVVTLAQGIAACQNAHDALRLICDAPLHSGSAQAEASMRMKLNALYIDEHLSNREISAFFEAVAHMSAEQRSEHFAALLNKEGIAQDDCAMWQAWKP